MSTDEVAYGYLQCMLEGKYAMGRNDMRDELVPIIKEMITDIRVELRNEPYVTHLTEILDYAETRLREVTNGKD